MFDGIKKRLTAGILAAAALTSSVPIPTASAEEGIMPLAEEENQPSSIEFEVGQDCGPMWDASPRSLTFSGDPTIWTANFKLEDGTIVHCYCASKGKGSPNGADYYIAEKVDDWKLASLANISDARSTLAAFLNSEVNKDKVLTETNFPQRAYFAASQIAVWTALGQGRIIGGEDTESHFSWASSTDLKTETGEQAYPADELKITFRADGGTTTEDRLVLYAAIKMLEYAAINGSYWESLGHAPWVGGAFTYGADYKDSGFLNLPTSIADSGRFEEEEYTRLSGPNAGSTKKYWVFHMTASASTFVMGNQITLSAKNMPEGAFLKTTNIEEGNPHVYESLDLAGDGVQTLGLLSVDRHNEYYENDNKAAWGQAFDLYIPQDYTNAITIESPVELTADMNVARYGAYIAKPTDGDTSIQNMLVVEPGVVHRTIKWALTAEETEDKVNLKLIKKDADDAAQSLQNAKFKIEYMDEGVAKTDAGITDENGTVTFDRLPLGAEVTITETEPPAGYTLMSPNPDKITLPSTPTETGTFEYTLTDKKDDDTVGLKIIKKDAENATKSLQGAEFKVEYTQDGTQKTLTGTTSADGSLSFTGLPLGAQVTITETKAPAGYKLMSPNPVTKTLPTTPGETGFAEYTFTDAPDTVGIKIIKKDADDATKLLQGAKFEVKYTDASGTPKTLPGVTDASGTATFSGLPLGAEVTITETKAPKDYKLMTPNPVTKTLPTTPGETGMVEYTFTDKKEPGTPDTPDIPDEPEDGELKIRKVDADTGANLAGASFKLEQIDGSFTTSAGPTDASGIVTIDGENLPTGSYKVTEINAPDGYVLNPEAQTFQWNNEEGQEVTITFKDYKKGALEIFKYDAVTNQGLGGATFELRKDGKVIDTLHTDETGHASKSGLSEGYYQLVEVNPPAGGYLKDDKVYEVYIDPEDTAEVVRRISIPNYTKLPIRVIKVDNGTSVPLPGFTFELYKGTTLIDTGTTDENGEVMFTNLEPGDYRVREAGGTEDYAVDAPDQFVTLVKDETEIPTLTFRNDKKRDYRIKKVDAETGAAIPGVVFEIFRDGQSLGQLPPTDANGEVQLEHTEFGTYNVKEVTVPPEYVKSDETFIMEIDKDSRNPFIFTIPNKHKKKLTLKKVDEETGLPMSGVTFDIYLDNNKIDSKTTTNGEIVIENAQPGTYRFEETRTLTGYELLRDPINIEMTADKDVVVTAKNHKRHDLIIYKRDATTHALLDGVTFEIFRDEQSLGDFITKNGGKIVIENAEPGTYKAVEKSTLKEYILNETTTVIEHTQEKSNRLYIDRQSVIVMLEPLFYACK